MRINLSTFIDKNKTVAVALSGGGDSMALLNYMLDNAKLYSFNVIALNVEHGIRGESSISDTEFVISYCKDKNIPLLTYSVDCITFAKENKLSLEQAGRILRYKCFYDAIESKKCDLVATAHHLKDNFESVLFNLFRGTGIKGVLGIEPNFENKIIRPFISIEKAEIENYLKEKNIPYVTDESNFSDDYTRNDIRLNVIPQIEKIFPNAENCVYRFCEVARTENEYLEEQTLKELTFQKDKVLLNANTHPALIARGAVKAMQYLGVEKDWEKAHIDSVIELAKGENGNKANLKKGIIAIKEYDKIAFLKEIFETKSVIPFQEGEIQFANTLLTIKQAKPLDLKNGFYFDADKIQKESVIRTRRDGDKFTKFNGGTKSLSDYFTDKKVPSSIRDSLPVIAVENEVLAIFDMAISDKIKIDNTTKTILQLTKEEIQWIQI